MLSEESIRKKVTRRVDQYAGSPDEAKKTKWLRDWFEPTLERIQINSLAWEEIINFVKDKDRRFGFELAEFYSQCCQYNRIQEPERTH